MVAMVVFGYREFFMQLFGSNLSGESYYFEEFFEENMGMLIILVLLLFLLGAAVTIIAYSFPVFYLKRLAETGNTNITSDQILGDLKINFWKVIKLFLGLIFIVTPAFVIMFLLSYVLVLIIIGFFLLIMLVPATMNAVNFLMYDYLTTNHHFFESLSYAVRAQFSYSSANEPSPFWKYWGTTAIVYLINYVITLVFSIVPMIILFGSMYTVPSAAESYQQNPFQGTLGIVFFLLYGVSILVSFLLMNVLLIASGLMYYDNRTDIHQKMDIIEIDTIGTNED